jgi:hypothetical protein
VEGLTGVGPVVGASLNGLEQGLEDDPRSRN